MDKNKSETFKKLRGVKEVPDSLKEEMKLFNKQKGLIKKTLLTGPESIPMIAEKTGISSDEVIYILMSMLKFDEVEVDKVDDMDEFFLYRIKSEIKNGEN